MFYKKTATIIITFTALVFISGCSIIGAAASVVSASASVIGTAASVAGTAVSTSVAVGGVVVDGTKAAINAFDDEAKDQAPPTEQINGY